jgi:HEAT repeat protein
MPLDDAFTGDSNPLAQILRQLGRLPESLRFEAVAKLLGEADPDTRARGLLAAKQIRHPDVREFCIRSLRDPSWYVRRLACELSIDFNLTDAVETLIDLLQHDESEFVRAACAIALGRLASKQAIPRLLSLAELVTGEDHEGTPVRQLLRQSVELVQDRPE